MIDRRRFLASASALAAGAALPAAAHPADAPRLGPEADRPGASLRDLTPDDLQTAAEVQGLDFTTADRELMLPDVTERLESLAAIRDAEPPNSVAPALVLDLSMGGRPMPGPGAGATVPMPSLSSRPAADRDLAFLSIPELGALLRSGAVTSVGLTELFLGRLRMFDPTLQCVVTLMPERALETARARDRELAAGAAGRCTAFRGAPRTCWRRRARRRPGAPSRTVSKGSTRTPSWCSAWRPQAPSSSPS